MSSIPSCVIFISSLQFPRHFHLIPPDLEVVLMCEVTNDWPSLLPSLSPALACEVATSTIVWLSRQTLETSRGPLPRTEEPVTKGAGSLPTPLHLVEGVKKLAVRWRQCLPGSCAESAMGTAETRESQQKQRRLGRPYGDILVGLPGCAAL